MAWVDRLKEAAYTSPGGRRYTFAYEDVRNTKAKKTTAFNFPDADGTYVQESGSAGRNFPLRCIFWGANYDREAEAFDAALFEPGVGKLEHPIYGTVDVVPTGTITRRDDLKTAANQAIIEVTFMSTIGLIYPSAIDDPLSVVLSAIAELNVTAAEVFGVAIDLRTAINKATFVNRFVAALRQIEASLQSVSNAAEFNVIKDSITYSVSTLTQQPNVLALQTQQLIQAPAKSTASPTDKVSAYVTLLDEVTNVTPPTDLNDYYTKELLSAAYVAGLILSVANTKFDTRVAAISAATLILERFDEVTAWKDMSLTALRAIDTGAAYQQLQAAVALTAGYIVEVSFSLKQERKIVLDRSRTIVDLAAELYGSVDDKLDFLIDSNDLSGSEILELPKGKEVVYYV